jgi:hypothetical protein
VVKPTRVRKSAEAGSSSLASGALGLGRMFVDRTSSSFVWPAY